MRAANAFRVTWTDRVFRLGYVTEMNDREGLERRRTGTRQSNDYGDGDGDGNENGKTAMGHFRVAPSLCFKARLTAKPLT